VAMMIQAVTTTVAATCVGIDRLAMALTTVT
jgi:hypothetical protein